MDLGTGKFFFLKTFLNHVHIINMVQKYFLFHYAIMLIKVIEFICSFHCRYMFRFVLLFSYIIPISLRVNLDMGKAFYSYQIQNDPEIQGI